MEYNAKNLNKGIKNVFLEKTKLDSEYLSNIAHTKRFIERWMGDNIFREEISNGSYKVSECYGLEADPEEMRFFLDKEIAHELESRGKISLTVRRYQEFIINKLEYRQQMQTQLCTPDNPRYRAWRQQQLRRTQSQLGTTLTQALVHAPVCFELSKGCSVGCWFCGVSAPSLEDIYLHTPENTRLWQEVLEVVKEVIGNAAGYGFCYWASDPLDNPDYEEFLIDFHAILGNFPQTTTAQPMKDSQRVRNLLKLSSEKGGWIDRFSILTLNTLNQVHKEFSAEELAFVELVPQNKESVVIGKHIAGRSRERVRRQAEKKQQPYPDDKYSGTVACVTGFLFNMVERSIKLISPCNADDKWPLGYRIYRQGYFTDGKSLKKLLEEMINTHMTSYVKYDDIIRLQRFLNYEKTATGFQLLSPFLIHSFSEEMDLIMPALGELMSQGNETAGSIALNFYNERNKPMHETFHLLNIFREMGLIDDEP